MDNTKSVTQRVESATEAGLGATSLIPTVAMYQSLYNAVLPSTTKDKITSGTQSIQKNF